ncbi:class Ib ribonucleoside-diphosphate reductase assembly flavoprotein NrdI [Enterococcus casseliflavus]|uniref:class Ib ribonucleoside-diphosphate reductase assembly flavoprotein NrdI n=1 Tax=Enterococcus casseliflavus TaxID=37734 RepID=UPI001BD0C828|nr:class Ib ribonucleoside-diphosphate reductase assembly flavoprotein NrdI [Enterococcus casseliflavus]WBY91530.1 class Ib ribonucleoside-diphosphate reductase assembly flavoprotein NrdI [Enterococcus casseliflavus]
MKLLYISISGNTRAFVNRLLAYADQQDTPSTWEVKEIHDNSVFEQEDEPYVVFVPTYLEGGNGVDNGDQEILTETMREYIDYENNAALCLGVIGSGNKNFNYQYCLTAKQYAEQFSIPFLADFELRGTTQDIEQIYACLKEIDPAHSNT